MSIYTKKRQQLLSPADYYRQRVQQRRGRLITESGVIPAVDEIVGAENLIRIFHRLNREAGQAPGPDGLTYSEFCASEVGMCMRGLSLAIRSGCYRPFPSLKVPIPKAIGEGYRVLSLRNVADRVIAAAVNEVLSPFWERVFLPGSMGFRSGIGVWDMLIRMETAMTEKDLWVVSTDDIKNAFDNVNIDNLMDDHKRYIQDARLLDLVEVVLRGDANRNLGIEQGNAYSPTALNVRLHHVHDLPFEEGQQAPLWFRYADNLAYLTRSVPEGYQALCQSRDLLQAAHFTLKGKDGPPADLREGGKAQSLGFLLTHEGERIRYCLGESAWKSLERDLEKAHESSNPPVYALDAIRGWIEAHGPAFEGMRRDEPERILRTAAHYGFRGIVALERLWEWWRRSSGRWQKRRKAFRRRSGD